MPPKAKALKSLRVAPEPEPEPEPPAAATQPQPKPRVSVHQVDTRAPHHAASPRTWTGGRDHGEIRRAWDAANKPPVRRPYHAVTSVVNAVQCRRLGWEYAYHLAAPLPDRHASWTKLAWVLEAWDSLSGVVVVLDTDAWIRDAAAFEFVLANLDPAAAAVFAGEPPCDETRQHAAGDLNGGFLCFRAGDERVRALFRAAWDDPGAYASQWPWEQAPLCRALREAPDAAAWARVLPPAVCNTPGGSHVTHCWFKDLVHDMAVDDLLEQLADWLLPAPSAAAAAALPAAGGGADDGGVEIVVARYKEDVSWVFEYASTASRITVYDKSGEPPPPRYHPKIRVVPLPNVGRESHTYLHHLVHERDSLASRIVFTQGNFADHVPRAEFAAMVTAGVPRKPRVGLDSPWASTLMQTFRWTAENNHAPGVEMRPAGMTLAKFYLTYVGDDLPPEREVAWHQSAIFLARRDRVLARPPGAYRALLDVLASGGANPEAGHYMERFWVALVDSEAEGPL